MNRNNLGHQKHGLVRNSGQASVALEVQTHLDEHQVPQKSSDSYGIA